MDLSRLQEQLRKIKITVTFLEQQFAITFWRLSVAFWSHSLIDVWQLVYCMISVKHVMSMSYNLLLKPYTKKNVVLICSMELGNSYFFFFFCYSSVPDLWPLATPFDPDLWMRSVCGQSPNLTSSSAWTRWRNPSRPHYLCYPVCRRFPWTKHWHHTTYGKLFNHVWGEVGRASRQQAIFS